MRTSSTPHPLFICCFLLSLLGAGLAAVIAIDTSSCGSALEQQCDANTQATVDASMTVALSSLVVAVGGIGFQLGRGPRPLPPPPPRGPVAGGPPNPGPTPYRPQGQ